MPAEQIIDHIIALFPAIDSVAVYGALQDPSDGVLIVLYAHHSFRLGQRPQHVLGNIAAGGQAVQPADRDTQRVLPAKLDPAGLEIITVPKNFSHCLFGDGKRILYFFRGMERFLSLLR